MLGVSNLTLDEENIVNEARAVKRQWMQVKALAKEPSTMATFCGRSICSLAEWVTDVEDDEILDNESHSPRCFAHSFHITKYCFASTVESFRVTKIKLFYTTQKEGSYFLPDGETLGCFVV